MSDKPFGPFEASGEITMEPAELAKFNQWLDEHLDRERLRMMAIVTDLAKADPTFAEIHHDGGATMFCTLCHAAKIVIVGSTKMHTLEHHPSCPYRRAVE